MEVVVIRPRLGRPTISGARLLACLLVLLATLSAQCGLDGNPAGSQYDGASSGSALQADVFMTAADAVIDDSAGGCAGEAPSTPGGWSSFREFVSGMTPSGSDLAGDRSHAPTSTAPGHSIMRVPVAYLLCVLRT